MCATYYQTKQLKIYRKLSENIVRNSLKLDFADVKERMNDLVSFVSSRPSDPRREFDYLTSECQNMGQEEKIFFIFLTTHFDNPYTAKDFYQRLNWKGLLQKDRNEISEICDEFFLKKRSIGGHRKHFNCLPCGKSEKRNKISYTVEILESYKKVIRNHGSQVDFFDINKKAEFVDLYQRMKEIKNFHTRLPRFDHLERISRTYNFYILPKRFYAEDSTGPLDGLTYLFFGKRYRKNKKEMRRLLTGSFPVEWNAQADEKYGLSFKPTFSEVIQALELWTIVNVKKLIPKQRNNPAIFLIWNPICATGKKGDNPMILENIWNFLKKKVFPSLSTEMLFNQYNDKDLSVDLPNADKIRRENLMSYLRSFSMRPYILVVGEAPGPWGCRFSGVPFTSETQLCNGDLPFAGRQSSINLSPYSENTATIFWNAMLPHHPKFFVWNCIPFHPHKRGKLLSIRNPTRVEVSICSNHLSGILSLVEPELIVAVGRKPELALNHIDASSIYVRHPSRGGANNFKTGIERIFNEL